MEDEKEKKYLSELFNFACVLRGEVKHLEKIPAQRNCVNVTEPLNRIRKE